MFVGEGDRTIMATFLPLALGSLPCYRGSILEEGLGLGDFYTLVYHHSSCTKARDTNRTRRVGGVRVWIWGLIWDPILGFKNDWLGLSDGDCM